MNSKWLLLVFAIGVLLLIAPLIAPYEEDEQHRLLADHPPTAVHLFSASGHLARPFVIVDSRPYALRFFPRVRHVVGVGEPGALFLFGSDQYGRDLLSRFLYGGRRALIVGVVAAFAAVGIGFIAGALAGFYGGWRDSALMRCSELSMSLPLVYLLLAIRALMPLNLGEFGSLSMVVIVAALAGWPRPARLVRGVFLSAKERPYVFVARSFGATNTYLITRHILPEVRPLLGIQVVTLLPQFMLIDVTFTFLGLGAGEPNASWGGLLASLCHFATIESHKGYILVATAIALILFLLQLAGQEQSRRLGGPSQLQ